jgi:hypothetical protein
MDKIEVLFIYIIISESTLNIGLYSKNKLIPNKKKNEKSSSKYIILYYIMNKYWSNDTVI